MAKNDTVTSHLAFVLSVRCELWNRHDSGCTRHRYVGFSMRKALVRSMTYHENFPSDSILSAGLETVESFRV